MEKWWDKQDKDFKPEYEYSKLEVLEQNDRINKWKIIQLTVIIICLFLIYILYSIKYKRT